MYLSECISLSLYISLYLQYEMLILASSRLSFTARVWRYLTGGGVGIGKPSPQTVFEVAAVSLLALTFAWTPFMLSDFLLYAHICVFCATPILRMFKNAAQSTLQHYNNAGRREAADLVREWQ